MVPDTLVLKLLTRRRQRGDISAMMPDTTYPATLSVEESPAGQRWLDLRFGTDPAKKTGNFFNTAINPRDFAVVAQLMIEADPECAIRAFGKAMEGAKIQKRSDQSGSDEAA